MAEICPVCGEKIGFLDGDFPQDGIEVHTRCLGEFFQDPEKYGGTVKTEPLTEEEKEAVEQRRKEQQQKIEDQSVYVKGFRMPFGEMVTFIFKWTMASVPTAIFLAILFLIFTAIFA